MSTRNTSVIQLPAFFNGWGCHHSATLPSLRRSSIISLCCALKILSTSRPNLLQFQGLEIHKSANFVLFKNVDYRLVGSNNCEMFVRVSHALLSSKNIAIAWVEFTFSSLNNNFMYSASIQPTTPCPVFFLWFPADCSAWHTRSKGHLVIGIGKGRRSPINYYSSQSYFEKPMHAYCFFSTPKALIATKYICIVPSCHVCMLPN